MAKSIKPVGKSKNTHGFSFIDGCDIAEMAKQQDRERRIREDNEYFEKTGINRLPHVEYDPLVPINGYTPPDIADDGDSYDESISEYNHHTADGEYAEDSPTKIIEPCKKKSKKSEIDEDLLYFYGIDVNGSKASKEETKAYIEREKIKRERDFTEKADKRKKKCKNAITGLELGEK